MVEMIWEDQGAREYMEDKVSVEEGIYSDYSYYAVFDGHGGAAVSTYLQQNFKVVIRDLLTKRGGDPSKISTLLYDAFQRIVNDIPYNISVICGSTAVVVLRHKNKLWVANCGDSRAIMNSGMDAVPLTSDHKPMRSDEQQRILHLGGKVEKNNDYDVYRVNGLLAVSRAIGDFLLAPYVTWKPEITEVDIKNRINKYVVIATDGIWDALTNHEVIAIVNKTIMYDDAKDIGKRLISTSRKRGSSDNIAICLILL